MALSFIELVFPFRIDGSEHRTKISSNIVRKENVVSFSTPNLLLCYVDAAKKYTVNYIREKHKSQIVCVSFTCINDAVDFEHSPVVHVSYSPQTETLSLDKEIHRVSLLLEETQAYWKSRKRSSCVDDEGYHSV